MKNKNIFNGYNMAIEILNGNELLIQGGLEAGFSLYTGYPGSPLADYFNILHKRKKEMEDRGIKVVIANSEANAAAMASGAKMAGQNTMVAMKSMGLHVAADALSVGNFANPGKVQILSETGEEIMSGVVVVVGDDPWSISTSTPADSRYLFKHLHIPFLEPSTPQELKDWIKWALEISQRSSVYQGLLLTTSMAEGGGRVQVLPAKEMKQLKDKVVLDPAQFDLQKNVMVPPNSLWADREMIEKRFPKVVQVLEQLSLDKTYGRLTSFLGFLSAGVVAETLKQFMEEENYLKTYSLYKLASSYPLVENLLLPYLKKLETLIIVEEKRGFLESEVKELCQKHGLNLKIYGKNFEKGSGFPAFGGLSFEIIRDKVQEALRLNEVNVLESKNLSDQKDCGHKHDLPQVFNQPLPPRYPTFCPGCPHRETLSLLKDIRSLLQKENVQLISHGDVGCYSLSFLPPFKEMHDLSAMGQGGALGAGTDIFIKNPSVVLMGDSTFYHSGISAISNSLQLNHNITYILLDNDNTAMTGHQMTPTSGLNIHGEVRPRQDIFSIIKAMGVKDIVEVNPSDRYFYKNLLLDFVNKQGLKVIVSNKECGLTFHGRSKKEERKIFAKGQTLPVKTFYQINLQSCEDCRECVESTGCPGLAQTFDAYGTKVSIDPQICVSDSYCTKIKACPSFERVDVFDYHPTKYQKENFWKQTDAKDLPLPQAVISLNDLGQGKDFRVVVTGVGGSGVTTISRVLAEAARHMGGRDDLDFKFFEQKGLAQRNGSVTGFLAVFRLGKSHGTVIPKHTADLVLSPDLLEGGRALDYLGPQGWAILDEEFQIPLSILLDRGESGSPLTSEELADQIKKNLGNRSFLAPLKKLSQDIFQRPVYAATMCLGLAFQAGRLPFSLKEMEEALRKAIPKDELENNFIAFTIGRKFYLEGEKKILPRAQSHDLLTPQKQELEDSGQKNLAKTEESIEFIRLLESSLKKSLWPWQNTSSFIKIFHQNAQILIKNFSFIKKEYLYQYLHDLYVYDRGQKVESFLEEALNLKACYQEEEELRLSLRLLCRTYFVKDEIFVAHLLISPQKKYDDEKKYGLLGKNFHITHINRPSFDVWGRKIEFDIHPKDWMLKFMGKMRFLRTLLPAWHSKEREISLQTRNEILKVIPLLSLEERIKRLRKLQTIKGYREIRYKVTDKVFQK